MGTAWGRGYSYQLLQGVGECNCVINLGLAGCSTQVTQKKLIGVPMDSIYHALEICYQPSLPVGSMITVVGAWLKLLNRSHACQSDIACGIVLYVYRIV